MKPIIAPASTGYLFPDDPAPRRKGFRPNIVNKGNELPQLSTDKGHAVSGVWSLYQPFAKFLQSLGIQACQPTYCERFAMTEALNIIRISRIYQDQQSAYNTSLNAA